MIEHKLILMLGDASGIGVAIAGLWLTLQSMTNGTVIPNWVIGIAIAVLGWFMHEGVKQVRGDIARLEQQMRELERRCTALEAKGRRP